MPREVVVVGIGHERPERSDGEAAPGRRQVEERVQLGKPAGERGQRRAPHHGVEVDIDCDTLALGLRKPVGVSPGADESPFLKGEESHSETPRERRNEGLKRPRYLERHGEPRGIVHGALGKVVAVDVGREQHPFRPSPRDLCEEVLGVGGPPPGPDLEPCSHVFAPDAGEGRAGFLGDAGSRDIIWPPLARRTSDEDLTWKRRRDQEACRTSVPCPEILYPTAYVTGGEHVLVTHEHDAAGNVAFVGLEVLEASPPEIHDVRLEPAHGRGRRAHQAVAEERWRAWVESRERTGLALPALIVDSGCGYRTTSGRGEAVAEPGARPRLALRAAEPPAEGAELGQIIPELSRSPDPVDYSVSCCRHVLSSFRCAGVAAGSGHRSIRRRRD